MKLDLSVVIPTHNRAPLLRLTLESLLVQSVEAGRFEVVVVDDGSTDDTPAVLDELSARDPGLLRHLRCEHALSGAARNAGIRESRGRLILSMDDDLLADRSLVQRHLEAHERHPETESAVLGRVGTGDRGVDLLDPDDWDVNRRLSVAGDDCEVDAALFTTQNVSLKRGFLPKDGPFTPGMPRLDDLDLAFRLRRRGLRLYYCADAVCTHLQPLDDVDKVLESGTRYGRALAQWIDRLPHLRDELPNLGARFSGGWGHSLRSPRAAALDTLRRGAINSWSVRPLIALARRLPVKQPPGRLLIRCCREIWAWAYRYAFRMERRRMRGSCLEPGGEGQADDR